MPDVGAAQIKMIFQRTSVLFLLLCMEISLAIFPESRQKHLAGRRACVSDMCAIKSGVSTRKAKFVEENHSGSHMEGENDFHKIIKIIKNGKCRIDS